MKIGIAGAGGIGSNVAQILVRSGMIALKIIDFDLVEAGNLNRQFYFYDQIGRLKVEMLAENLRRIRPDARIETIVTRLDGDNCAALFADCQLVVEGLDQQADKKMLVECLAGKTRGIVSACGIAGSDLQGIGIRRLGTCFVVGDFVTDCIQAPVFPGKVLAVSCRMAEIIQKIVNDNDQCNEG